MKNSATHGDHFTRWPAPPFIASSTIVTGGVIDYPGPCRVINYFVTVMVIFFEMTGGLCGT